MKKIQKIICAMALMLVGLMGLSAMGQEVVVDNCDSSTHFYRSRVDYYNYIEGEGCVSVIAGITPELKGEYTLDLSGMSEGSAYLELYLYLGNSKSMQDGYIRMGSGEGNYYEWTSDDIGARSGWNYVSLAFADATKTGSPDFNGLNSLTVKGYMPEGNLYVDVNTVHIKVDDIRITDDPGKRGEYEVTEKDRFEINEIQSPDSGVYDVQVTYPPEGGNGGNGGTGSNVGIIIAICAVVVVAAAGVGVYFVIRSKKNAA